MDIEPELVAAARGGVHLLEDPGARRAGVMVAFSDRRGGVSRAPYDSLNLSQRAGDDPDRVVENRRRAAAAAGFAGESLVLAWQVHGAELLEAQPGTSGVIGEGDGLVAREPGVTIGILTADCTPVVISGERGIAILHAGWRGLVAGIIEKGAEAVGPVRSAWVGPAVRGCCYEVGPEVVDAFRARSLPVAAPDRVDPSDAAVSALRAAGVERPARADVCTMCDHSFFSYRRDGVTGRQGAFAALVEAE